MEIQKLKQNRIFALDTARLTLREMTAKDARDMFEYAALPEVTRYLLWNPHPDLLYTPRYLSYVSAKYRTGEFFDWAITLRDSGKMIGTCGFCRFDFPNDMGEIGYVINPSYQNNGYATEAVRAVISFGFDVLSLHRIEARYILENKKSAHVMEKCGMQFEGVQKGRILLRGKYEDVGICAVTRP